MIRPALIALLFLAAASPATAQAPKGSKSPDAVNAALLSAVKAAGAKVLKDPYSAQWENMHRAIRPNVRGEPTEVVCGYVNAKNSYGAYSGRQPFVYFLKFNDINIAGNGDAIVTPAILKTFCTGLI